MYTLARSIVLLNCILLADLQLFWVVWCILFSGSVPSQFDPSMEEMEEFKQRAGVHSDLPKMGRPSITGGMRVLGLGINCPVLHSPPFFGIHRMRIFLDQDKRNTMLQAIGMIFLGDSFDLCDLCRELVSIARFKNTVLKVLKSWCTAHTHGYSPFQFTDGVLQWAPHSVLHISVYILDSSELEFGPIWWCPELPSGENVQPGGPKHARSVGKCPKLAQTLCWLAQCRIPKTKTSTPAILKALLHTHSSIDHSLDIINGSDGQKVQDLL